MKQGLTRLICVLVMGLISFSAYAGDWEFTPKAGISYLTGETSYDINFPVSGVTTGRSKLKWDVDAALFNVGMDVTYYPEFLSYVNSTVFSFDYASSFSEGNGTFHDQDWIYNSAYSPALQGDTKSRTKSPVEMYDLRWKFVFIPVAQSTNFRFNASVGYLQQDLGTFTAKNLTGFYGPLFTGGSMQNVNAAYDNSALDYKVTYKIPYIGLGFDWDIKETLRFTALFDYSAWANAKDRDDHVLRGKLSESDCDGDYLAITGKLLWQFNPAFGVSLEATYMNMDLSGKQNQYDYFGNYVIANRISSKIKSDQTSVGLKVMYTF